MLNPARAMQACSFALAHRMPPLPTALPLRWGLHLAFHVQAEVIDVARDAQHGRGAVRRAPRQQLPDAKRLQRDYSGACKR